MSRAFRLFLITHGYPLAMVCHMQWGNKSGVSKILFQVIPIVFVFLLIAEWVRTSSIKLGRQERHYLDYFSFTFIMLHIYYIICYFEGKEWTDKHNQYFFWYGIITTVFYITIHVYRKIKLR